MLNIFKFPVKSFRKLPSPFEEGENAHRVTHVAYVLATDVPEGIPMDPNPRDQNLKTKVAQTIRESLISDTDSSFFLKNRGIVISAKSVRYDNKDEMITMVTDEAPFHGDIDGGHTYKIILENKAHIELEQYVRFEIMSNVEDIVTDIAAARNTSTQVDDKSIAELENKFDIIKEAIGNEPFFNKISFKQNAEGDLDVRDIIAILNMFNIEKYDDDRHPTISYTGKAQCVTSYLKDYEEYGNSISNPYKKMKNLAPDIFKLYNEIELSFAEAYNQSSGRYGSLNFAGYKEGKIVQKLKYSPTPKGISYKIPDPFIYSLLAAFRSIVGRSANGYYEWKVDPIAYFKKLNTQLATETVNRTKTLGSNPNALGKDSGHWNTLYMIVENAWLRERNR